MPSDSLEQKKIADCLSLLDAKIETQSKNIEVLKRHKKGLMQQFFPKTGEGMPRLRFPEFKEAPIWEKKTLRETCSYVDYRGKTPAKSSSGIFLVTAKNIKIGYIDYDISKEYVQEHEYPAIMSRGLPLLGDVLITTEAPCGNIAQVDRTNIALAQRIIKYRGKKKVIYNTFLKFALMSPDFQNTLLEKCTGGAVKGIKGSILHQLHIALPPLPEQQKIADCLSSLDTCIEAHIKKFNLLKEYKKGLLQQLFPQASEPNV